MKQLSAKGYESLKGLRSLDMVFLFVPIEGAFHAALNNDQRIFQEALQKGVVIVSPTTLLMSLRIIKNIWQYEDQNENTRHIIQKSGELYDKFVGFLESMEKVGNGLESAQKHFQEAHKKISTGKGNLIRRAKELKDLGVPVKKELHEKVEVSETEEENILPIQNSKI